MIDGLLFILIVLNFAITITLYIRYSKGDRSDLIDEIVGITNKFNSDAERNIQILEERIKVLDSLLSRSEVFLKSRDNIASNVIVRDKVSRGVSSPNDKGLTSSLPSLSKRDATNNSAAKSIAPSSGSFLSAEKTYIQKAYSSPRKNVVDAGVSEGQMDGQEEEGVVDVVKNLGKNKDKSHRIARFIGEGKSYEEIANILGMSLGEIQLFASLLRKKIRGK